MKGKMMMMAVAVVLLTACEKEAVNEAGSKSVTFAVEGDFGNPVFTRAMTADGKAMTDLYVFDYMGEELKQTVHQTGDDDDFGSPTVTLAYGQHRLYFVASRGDGVAVSGTVVSWSKPSDTFWAAKNVTVNSGSAGTQTVTLGRVSTKLKLTVMDKVPEGIATVSVAPAQWWYGMDYTSGVSLGDSDEGFVINVPASYVGTKGKVTLSIFGLSDEDEWLSDVTVTAKDGSGGVLGTATIHDAPFMRNRCTEYSGRLFASNNAMSVSLDDTWEASYVGEW